MSRSERGEIEKINFIVAGAQKCGTTALHYSLEKHPNIALPDKRSYNSSITKIFSPKKLTTIHSTKSSNLFGRRLGLGGKSQITFTGNQRSERFGATTKR